MYKKLSVIIPVFNEENTILQIVDSLEKVILIDNIEKEYVIVNDCSSDNSKNIIEEYIKNNKDIYLTIEGF